MADRLQPAVVEVQEILNGNKLDGASPSGVAPPFQLVTEFRGKYRKYLGCTHAGLFEGLEKVGKHLRSISWKLPGVASLTVALVDEDGVEYEIFSSVNVSGTERLPYNGVLVPPGWQVKATTPGNVTGDGRIAATFGQGWGYGVYDGATSLGSASFVPAEGHNW